MTIYSVDEHRSVIDKLAMEAKLSTTLLKELQREIDTHGRVDPKKLGVLYEQSLAKDEDRQRGLGSFYTPEYLVAYVLERTLAPLLRSLSFEQILKLRILDPSCGGGAFLLGALHFLEQHCVGLGQRAGPHLRQELSVVLVGIDIDAGALAVSQAALQLAIGSSTHKTPFSQLTLGDALLPEIKVGRIDVIVGNPPWGQKRITVSLQSKKRYKELFRSAKGVFDPFKLFVERCHQLLDLGGRWGLVLPDIVLLKNYQIVRDIILQGTALDEITHCGQAFPGAKIDTVMICGTRKKMSSTSSHLLHIRPTLSPQWQTGSVPGHKQKQSMFWEMPGHRFNMYLHGTSLELYRRLRENPRLDDALEMHEGVHSGNCRSQLFRDSKEGAQYQALLLGGKELGPFKISWGGRWVNTDKTCIDRAGGQYANLGQPHWHRSGKLVVRRTGDRIIAAYDSKGYYVSNNFFVLMARHQKHECFSRALVALLNSRFMTWYFRAVQPRKGRLFAELKLVHLREFPMPRAPMWGKVESDLTRIEQQFREEGASLKGALTYELNSLVENAYELSPEEKEVIKLTQC